MLISISQTIRGIKRNNIVFLNIRDKQNCFPKYQGKVRRKGQLGEALGKGDYSVVTVAKQKTAVM